MGAIDWKDRAETAERAIVTYTKIGEEHKELHDFLSEENLLMHFYTWKENKTGECK